MVAAAQLRATPDRSAFFASWLVIDRDADCSSLRTWFSWRFVPRSYCKCWERGPGPCWFFPHRCRPRFHLFEEMRKYLFCFFPRFLPGNFGGSCCTSPLRISHLCPICHWGLQPSMYWNLLYFVTLSLYIPTRWRLRVRLDERCIFVEVIETQRGT